MNKLIVVAVATAVSGFVSVPAQAAPAPSGSSSVTVVNTTAAPVPTTVQNVVGVDVLAAPPTRARIWMGSCTINPGSYTCDYSNPVYAPAGMVMRVVGLTGIVNARCQIDNTANISLSGAFKTPGGVDVSRRAFVTGTVLRQPNSTATILELSGNAFFTTITHVQFALVAPAANCGVPNFGEVTVHYQLEPLA
jgi:hypothetical protein